MSFPRKALIVLIPDTHHYSPDTHSRSRESRFTMPNQFIQQVFTFLLIVLLSGCSSRVYRQEISVLNNHIENEYFTVDIPYGWEVYHSESHIGNKYFDFLDPHYPKFRIRIAIGLDTYSLDNDDQLSPWARLSLLFTQLVTKKYDIKSRSERHININGKPATDDAYSTDDFTGHLVSLLGKNYTYYIYYWSWNDFSQDTKDRIEQVVYSVSVP